MASKVIFYVDGYNLYHALANLQAPHLKWLDLQALASMVIPKKSETLQHVHLFTALAHHMSDPSKVVRHQAYLDALSIQGVKYTLGFFSPPKATICRRCGNSWPRHEEKETDTNIATQMVIDAFDDAFDVAYLISSDADMTPPVRFIKTRFPAKRIITVAAPTMRHSASILALSDGKIQLKPKHIEACLLPAVLASADGSSSVTRPAEYDPSAPVPPRVRPPAKPIFEIYKEVGASSIKAAEVFRNPPSPELFGAMLADLRAGDDFTIKPV